MWVDYSVALLVVKLVHLTVELKVVNWAVMMVRLMVEKMAGLLADSWGGMKAQLWADDLVALLVVQMVALTVH